MHPRAYVNGYVDGDQLVLLYRSEQGELLFKRAPAQYVSFFKRSEVPASIDRQLRNSDNVAAMVDEGEWTRVTWKPTRFPRKGRDGRQRDILIRDIICQDPDSPVRKANVPTYEGDVHPVQRYLVDNECSIQRPRRVYLDIETDSRVSFAKKEEMRVLSWAIEDDEGRTAVGVLNEDTDEDEGRLLFELWNALSAYDQVLAWNGDRFDFPVIMARSALVLQEHVGDARRWLWLDHLELFKRMNVTASESGDEKASLRLQDVAMSVVGEGKDAFDGSKTWHAWACARPVDVCPGCGAKHDYSPRECMVRYNQKDTHLLRRIEEKTGYIELFFTLCDSCGVFPDSEGTNPTKQVDAFMLRLGRKREIHFATYQYKEHVEQFLGAYVMEPAGEGIERNVHVADFARLYPSVIITWNISPETRVSIQDPAKPIPPGHCRAPRTNVLFRNDVEGVLPIAVKEMLRLRSDWNKKKAAATPGTTEWKEADRRSTAYKIAANSFFGVVSSPFSRYYDKLVGESITQGGVELLMQTIGQLEKRTTAKNIYGDTDSFFGKGISKGDFESFVKWCNAEFYPELVKRYGCTTCAIELAYEKAFDRIVLVGKKRYAGRYLHYKGSPATKESKPEIKGLEFKRGDTAKLARELQEQVIKLLLGDWEEPFAPATEDVAMYERLLRAWQQRILDEPMPLELCSISKSLSKALPPTPKETETWLAKQREKAERREQPWTEVEEKAAIDELWAKFNARGDGYKTREKNDGGRSALPAQVQVAMMLKDRGEEVHVGTKISYVVVDGSSNLKVIPASDFTGECDRFYLWENLVWPATERVLEAAFPKHDWSQFAKVRPKKPRQPRAPKAIPAGGETTAKVAVPRQRKKPAPAPASEAPPAVVSPPAAPLPRPEPPVAPAAPRAARTRPTAGRPAVAVPVADHGVNLELSLGDHARLAALVERYPGTERLVLVLRDGASTVRVQTQHRVSAAILAASRAHGHEEAQ